MEFMSDRLFSKFDISTVVFFWYEAKVVELLAGVGTSFVGQKGQNLEKKKKMLFDEIMTPSTVETIIKPTKSGGSDP